MKLGITMAKLIGVGEAGYALCLGRAHDFLGYVVVWSAGECE